MSTDGALPKGHTVWPEGHDLIVLDTCDSTMAAASRRADSLKRPTWIRARRQTDGKGRRGKHWLSDPGNLAATLIFKPYCTPAEAARRSFLAANALFETLSILVDRNRLSLKWPNDVLLDGGKVAGILLETSGSGPYVDWLSIGIGVNLATAPDGVENAAFDPVAVGTDATPEEVMPVLASNYATQERKLDHYGFERIREDWLSHAAKLGDVITARTGREEITGTFDTVDKDGNLVLITGTGPRAIPAADVFF